MLVSDVELWDSNWSGVAWISMIIAFEIFHKSNAQALSIWAVNLRVHCLCLASGDKGPGAGGDKCLSGSKTLLLFLVMSHWMHWECEFLRIAAVQRVFTLELLCSKVIRIFRRLAR